MLFDADLNEAVRVNAMAAARVPDWEASYRFVCRWYSKNYATPLTEVLELPMPFVLQHFYEEYYRNMDANELREKIRDAIESPEERLERERREKAADTRIAALAKADFARIQERLQKRKAGAKTSTEQVKKDFEEAGKKLDGMLAAVPQTLDGAPMVTDDGFRIGEK